MVLNATVATACTITVIAIRWLALVGVLRDYSVTRTTGSLGSSYTSWTVHRHIGLATGPSVALTNLDRLAWKLALAAGILWMLRLGVRAAGRRVGVMRFLGVIVGLGLFVATGVMHRIADVVHPAAERAWIHRVITWWCTVAVIGVVIVMATDRVGGPSGPPVLGDHAQQIPIAWSITRAVVQLGVALGGWLLAASFTRRWLEAVDRREDGIAASSPAPFAAR
jgi:hypothetical protein